MEKYANPTTTSAPEKILTIDNMKRILDPNDDVKNEIRFYNLEDKQLLIYGQYTSIDDDVFSNLDSYNETETQILSELLELTIIRNTLTELPNLLGLNSLEYLELSNNNLSGNMDLSILPTSLLRVWLQYNNITSISNREHLTLIRGLGIDKGVFVFGSGVQFTDDTLQGAVNAWITDEDNARDTYGDISTWDVSSVTDMSYMFRRAASFNGNISGWDVSSVTDMNYMFYAATSFNGDICKWKVSSNMNDEYFYFRCPTTAPAASTTTEATTAAPATTAAALATTASAPTTLASGALYASQFDTNTVVHIGTPQVPPHSIDGQRDIPGYCQELYDPNNLNYTGYALIKQDVEGLNFRCVLLKSPITTAAEQQSLRPPQHLLN